MDQADPELPKDGPMTDEEIQEMVFLFRVVRAENDKPGEVERCRELMRRFEMFYNKGDSK